MSKPSIDKITELINKEPIVQQKIIFEQVKNLISDNVREAQKILQDEASAHETFVKEINGQ